MRILSEIVFFRCPWSLDSGIGRMGVVGNVSHLKGKRNKCFNIVLSYGLGMVIFHKILLLIKITIEEISY